MILFFIQSIFFLVMGCLFIVKRKFIYLVTVVVLGALLPYSAIFNVYFYFSGANVFDFFIIGMALSSLYLLLIEKVKIHLPTSIVIYFFIIVNFLFFSIVISIFYNEHFRVLSVIKDIKPLFLIFTIYFSYKIIVSELGRKSDYRENGSFVSSHLLELILVVKCVILLYLNYNGFLSSPSSDGFYTSDAEMISRYSDFSMVFILVSFIFTSKTSPLFSILLTFLAALLLSLISGNRTFLFIYMIIFITFSLNSSAKGRLFASIFGFLLCFYFLIILAFDLRFENSINIENLDRFSSLLSYETIQRLLEIRYSPLFQLYESDTSLQAYIFGFGAGTSFYIPWFAYRPGIDPYSAFIDNFYLSILAKFGVVGLLTLTYFFYLLISKVSKDFLVKSVVSLALFAYCTTMSLWYQSSFSYLAICWLFFSMVQVKRQK